MQSIFRTLTRWDALQMAIKSQNIDDQNKVTLQTAKAYERNRGFLQKAGIYSVCILGVLKFQHHPYALFGLCSIAAAGTLMSDIYLSNMTWEKTSEIVKNVTGYRQDYNIRPQQYKRMAAEMQTIRKNLLQQTKDDDLVND